MFEQDLQNFMKLIVVIISGTYNKQFTPVEIEVYWRALKTFSFEDVRAAVDNHIQNPDGGQFLPNPADIIRAIRSNSQQALAWKKTLYAMRSVGRYESVGFDDALIHLTVKSMSSWPKLCSTNDRQLPFVEKEFQKRYWEYSVKNPLCHPKYLKGIVEMLSGRVSSPVLIGDVIKAKRVIATGTDAQFLINTKTREIK
ncbi:conserved hypothetical protein [Gammaproteobacteria bacterium]